MSLKPRIALLALAAVIAFAGAATAADQLELVSLAPAGGPMAPGAMVTATLRYNLESAPDGKIGTYTLGVPGNPPHISLETPVFVKKGSGTVKTTFGIRCDARYPAPILIRNLRYVLFKQAPGGPITGTLVERFRDVKFEFECPKTPPQGDGKPDITSKRGITIGTVFIAWGGTGTLHAADAIQSSPNKACAFNATYDMVNVGAVATSPAFLNRLKVDATSVVAINSALALSASEARNITTQPYLPFGTHRLTLLLDNDANVAESNEGNNSFTVTYKLEGPCKVSANLPGAAAPR